MFILGVLFAVLRDQLHDTGLSLACSCSVLRCLFFGRTTVLTVLLNWKCNICDVYFLLGLAIRMNRMCVYVCVKFRGI